MVTDNLLSKSNDMNDIPILTNVVFDFLFGIFIIVSLLFNILVSNVYYRNDHIITHQAVLVLCLITANLLWTIGIMPFSFAAGIVGTTNEYKSDDGLWVFQDPVCGIVGFGNAFVPLGKLFTVILMLGERSIAILLEVHYRKIMNKWLFAVYILLAWFLALLCGLIPPGLGFYSTVSPGKGTCFPPLNVYAAIVFYILYLIGGLALISLMAKKQESQQDSDPVPLPPTSPTKTTSSKTIGPTVRQYKTQHSKMNINYEKGNFESLSANSSNGLVIKSPLRHGFKTPAFTKEKDLVDYDLHTGKSKMSKEYNGVLALFALYAICYLPIAVTSVVNVPIGLDNLAVLMLYATAWLDPLILLVTRVLLRRALDRMCFEVCFIELQCCVKHKQEQK